MTIDVISIDGEIFVNLSQIGPQGIPGPGVVTGGTTGQYLAKLSDANFDTGWVDAAASGVRSVFGRNGDVLAVTGDYNLQQISAGTAGNNEVIFTNNSGIPSGDSQFNYDGAGTLNIPFVISSIVQSPTLISGQLFDNNNDDMVFDFNARQAFDSTGSLQFDFSAPGNINFADTILNNLGSVNTNSLSTDGISSFTGGNINIFNNVDMNGNNITVNELSANDATIFSDDSYSVFEYDRSLKILDIINGFGSVQSASSLDAVTIDSGGAFTGFSALYLNYYANSPVFFGQTNTFIDGSLGDMTLARDLYVEGNYYVAGGKNFILDNSTGSSFGTATNQKLSFYGATPVIQQSGNAIAALVVMGLLASPTAITAAQGGTGQATYAVGDLLYASGATTLSRLADIATGNALISGGVTTAPSWGKIGLATHVSGNLPVTNLNSGTSASSTTFWRGDGTWATPAGGGGGTPGGANGSVQYNNAGSFGGFFVGGDATLNATTGNLVVTKTNGVSFAASATTDTTNASNISSGTLASARLPTPTTLTLGGIEAITAVANKWINAISTSGIPLLTQPAFTDISGTATAAQGGTGNATYAIGDILYASTTTALSRLADVATGNALISGGVTTAPSWGKVGLATHVSGNLPVTNLNSGTSASSTTFWRGDGTWATPSGSSTGNFVFSGDTMTDANGVVVVKQVKLNAYSGTGELGILFSTGLNAIDITDGSNTYFSVDSSKNVNIKNTLTFGGFYNIDNSLKLYDGAGVKSLDAPARRWYDGANLLAGDYSTLRVLIANDGNTTNVDWSRPNHTIIPGSFTYATVNTMANATTITPDATYNINKQANTQSIGTLTVVAASGSSVDGQLLEIIISSTNVQTFSWSSAYVGCTTTPLPTATTGTGKTDKFFFQYNATGNKWQIYNAQFGYA